MRWSRLRRVEQVVLAQDDELRFSHLSFEEVADAVVERSGGAEKLSQACWLDEDGKGCEGEGRRMEAFDRRIDRGRQVSAAADGFGKDHVRQVLLHQLRCAGDELREPATEASVGDLGHVETEVAYDSGVDEVRALVVGDDTDANTSRHQLARRSDKCRRLSGAKEAANTRESHHGMSNLPHRLSSARRDHYAFAIVRLNRHSQGRSTKADVPSSS